MFIFLLLLGAVTCGPATDSYKDQYCTDPRTMRKHAAYTEWADAYSCTRHRCQPGGRNLAIYTVGCKRVEAPESAIECEEVVEDTNMQFPFCCTRLRCLVVVRGEVWTRVLGQPWETLPAAPWSHMYKMKKPPPQDGAFPPKTGQEQGPVYELTDTESDGPREKVLRANKKSTDTPDCNDAAMPRAAPAPDIVIALSTNSDPKELKPSLSESQNRYKRVQKEVPRANAYLDDERDKDHLDVDGGDFDDAIISTEKPNELGSEERYFANAYGVTQKVPPFAMLQAQKHHQTWTEIPQNQWNEHDPVAETESNKENPFNQQDFVTEATHKPEEKPSNLQALVDAIGSRMRDIESVVQRMSDKVHKPTEDTEKRSQSPEEEPFKRHKELKVKKPGTDEHYKRFSVRNRSKYMHTSEPGTEQPLFVEDNKMTGYFSDASNTLRRQGPKEPAQTYMAPVETRRKIHPTDTSEEKKRKKHHTKKKKNKHHKKRHSKKKFNRLSSTEVDKNAVSLEDSSAAGAT